MKNRHTSFALPAGFNSRKRPAPWVRPVGTATVPFSRQRVLLGEVSAALRQQMFFWGRDVLSGGNLLLRHGFDKLPSAGLKGTSCYRISFQDGVIELHGACAGWYPATDSPRPGFLFVRHTGRCASHQLHEPVVPGSHDVTALQSATATTMTAARTFMTWLAGYEEWIQTETNCGYRRECQHMLMQMPKGKPWLPAEQALEWMRIFATNGPETSRPRQMFGPGRR